MYIELKNLSKAYGKTTVVEHLNLSVGEGEILCLLGASGCGKTTTLQMIGGFLEPDEGNVIIDGEDVTDLPPERRPVSTVFQSYALFPHKTVLQNVVYGLKFNGYPRREAKERGMEYLHIVGLADYAGARIQELSGGQQQRVALARALVVNPKVVLLDEPLSNLDAKLRVKLREELRELQRSLGMTMIFVTHDQEEAMVLADQIGIMNEGRLVQVGTPEEVYSHPADAFVMNFLGMANRIVYPGGREIFVRPEAVRFSQEGQLAGRVVKREYLGFYHQYQIDLGDTQIVVRGTPEERYEPGEQVRLRVEEACSLLV